MPKLNLNDIPEQSGSGYPAPFDQPIAGRARQRLGDAGGLTQFGVNRLQIPPGTWSSQRHWHALEDEFIYVLSGEVVLVTDEGEQVLAAGEFAAFPAGQPNGHQLINKSSAMAVCLEVGSRKKGERAFYPDIDLVYDPANGGFTHRDGTPYPPKA